MNFILMADVVKSRSKNQLKLINDFKEVVKSINVKMSKNILSPLTITLGDEFQGVLSNLSSALACMINMEEEIIRLNKNLQLRYVLVEGEIKTKINSKVAYEMLGPGLTQAREYLTQLKESNVRFKTRLRNEKKQDVINNAFLIFQGLVDDWNLVKDSVLISTFFEHKDYKIVAQELAKDRSLMWKRQKSLKLDEYFAIKEIINYLGDKND